MPSYRPESQCFGGTEAHLEGTRTRVNRAFIGKAYLIGSICPKYWFRIVSPGIGAMTRRGPLSDGSTLNWSSKLTFEQGVCFTEDHLGV